MNPLTQRPYFGSLSLILSLIHIFLPGGIGDGWEKTNIETAKLYKTWDKDIRVEEIMTDDAEIILTAYGISARICKVAVKKLREEGIKAGMIRPVTISPDVYKRQALIVEK